MRLDFLIEIERCDVKTVSLIVAECKHSHATRDSLRLSAICRLHSMRRVTACLCMAFVEMCKLLKYAPSGKSAGSVLGFKLYQEFTLMLPQMFGDGFEQIWLENHTEFLLRILYYCIQ